MDKSRIDLNEAFSPVVKHTFIRVFLYLVASLNLELEQLDIKTTSFRGDLEEEIYMSQPKGFVDKTNPNLVCKLKKGLYGLRQASRQWYKKLDNFMQDEGYIKCESDHCVYFKGSTYDTTFTVLLLYVDDMLIVSNDVNEVKSLKSTHV